MRINNIHSSINFGEKFKTKDVLSFISGYPISQSSLKPPIERRIIKSMTGIDIDSDSFKKTDLSNTFGEIILQTKCIEEMGKQNPMLKKADESADKIFTKVPKDKKEIKQWTESITKSIGDYVDIKPFKISYDVLKKEYLELLESVKTIGLL